MLRKLKNALFYAGVDHLSFERISLKIQKTNLIMTIVLSLFATILILAMFILSFESESVDQNRIVYILGLIMSLLILLLSATIAKKHYWMTILLVNLSYTIYYMYGILIGAITDPTGKTVTFMVLLVFMPVLFISRPIYTIAVTIFYDTIFIILCLSNKEGTALSVDIIDAIIFGILGCASGAVINHMKVRGYLSEQKLQELGHLDQLTQIKNRNAYEFERDSIPDLCKHSLGFVYMDVNGLHELNNKKGHEYGDRMLKQVATEVKYTFGEQFSFRIGGDEFVAFVPDAIREEIEKKISEMIKKIEKDDYHIAVGYDISKLRHLSLDSLVKSAEGEMFHNKKRYYKDIANREIRNTK